MVLRDYRKMVVDDAHGEAAEALRAWVWAQVCRLEYMLTALQMKTDFKPKVCERVNICANSYFNELC